MPGDNYLCCTKGGIMKKILFALLVVTSFMGFTGVVHSVEPAFDGNDILKDCSLAFDMTKDAFLKDLFTKGARPLPSSAEQTKAMQCFSYVIGFKDALYVTQVYHEKWAKQSDVCLPYNNLNNKEALRIVLTYLKGNPELLARPQAALVYNAFYYAFPCSGQKQ
jgi:hypothetical protein